MGKICFVEAMKPEWTKIVEEYKTEYNRTTGGVAELEEITGSRGWFMLKTRADMPASKIRISQLKEAVARLKNRKDFGVRVNKKDALSPMPIVNPRRPFDDDKPEGYLESLVDWFDNNHEAVEWFLENAEKIREIVEKRS